MEEIVVKSESSTKNGLNIIIVGCGKVGSTLTERLCKEGHAITVTSSAVGIARMRAATFAVSNSGLIIIASPSFSRKYETSLL